MTGGVTVSLIVSGLIVCVVFSSAGALRYEKGLYITSKAKGLSRPALPDRAHNKTPVLSGAVFRLPSRCRL